MTKHKALLIVIAALFINFCLNNISFTAESTKPENNKTDYTYEFIGKDKFENFNRKIFIFNSKLNKFVIRPVNTIWASIMPKYGMDRIRNFYTNIEYPVRLASCLLQKDFKSSGKETVRFFTNTTLGLGGLYDPAKNHFKIESKEEDIEQALAHYNVKQGPFLVLPIIPPGNIRGIAGEILDYSLNPTSYIIGPVPLMAKAGLMVNRTTYTQALIKTIDDTFADPYEITKKLYGVDQYIKNSNIDSKEVFAEKVNSSSDAESDTTSAPALPPLITENKINTNPSSNILISSNPRSASATLTSLKPDIKLDGYNPQSPVIDSMRTALFEVPNLNNSIWSEMSVWNRSFSEKIKTSSVQIDKNRPNYKYRYILQKNKNAPLAILYPSIGEGVMSHHPVVMAKLFYDEGYSVLIQGSTFHWEFYKSMPADYRPGLPAQDAECARIVTSKILDSLQSKRGCKFDKKMMVGTSFGALTTLFIAAKEEENNTLNISNYISINPPIELMFALNQIDKNSLNWEKDPSDIKLKTAITAQKVIKVTQDISNKKLDGDNFDYLPFNDDEAKFVVGFLLKQKLSDLVFTIEKGSKSSKNSELYKMINNMNFYDYAQKYFHIDEYASAEKFNHDTSLYTLTNFLQKNEKYKIYHTLDDYFVNKEQLCWLKSQSKNKAVYFNHGSHLGFLYRKEFIDEFKKDIALNKTAQKKGL